MIDSAALYKEVTGSTDGREILLLHGWGSSVELMRPIAEGLADSFRIHSIDLPGHGKSAPPAVAMGVPESAALVADYIKSNMKEPVAIIGHSNGGRISLYMASEEAYSSLIDRLILISPSGIRRKRSTKFYMKKYFAKSLKLPFSILPPMLKEPGLNRLRQSLIWKSLGSSDYKKLSGVMRESFVETVNFYVEDRLAKIDVPVLLFRGTKDEAISDRQMRVLDDNISDSGYIELANAGHYGYLEQKATVINAAKHFLSE